LQRNKDLSAIQICCKSSVTGYRLFVTMSPSGVRTFSKREQELTGHCEQSKDAQREVQLVNHRFNAIHQTFILVHGTFARLIRIRHQRLNRNIPRQPGATQEQKESSFMDAKFNWLIDSATVRVGLNTLALAAWIAAAVALLELGSRS